MLLTILIMKVSDGWRARSATPPLPSAHKNIVCTLNQTMIMTKIIIMISMIMLIINNQIINNHDPNHHDFVESSCGPQPHQLRRHDILCGPFHFIVHWILAAHPFEMIIVTMMTDHDNDNSHHADEHGDEHV